jgi:hypothetical protein
MQEQLVDARAIPDPLPSPAPKKRKATPDYGRGWICTYNSSASGGVWRCEGAVVEDNALKRLKVTLLEVAKQPTLQCIEDHTPRRLRSN